MPLHALKAQWSVTAGVIPGQVMPEHTKVWHYLSEDYEEDQRTLARSDTEVTRFQAISKEAREYCDSLTDPRALNWVKLEWMWM